MNSPEEPGPGAAALRELVMPVVVVAARDGGEVSCATSTTAYVSVQPPILTVALAPGSRTARLARRSGRFSVSVLAAGQADVAQRAGRPADGPDKLAAASLRPEQPPAGTDGPPGIEGTAAVLWCDVTDEVTAGDHQVFFGQVRVYRGAAGDPVEGAGLLLRHRRRYLGTGRPVTPPEADGYPV